MLNALFKYDIDIFKVLSCSKRIFINNFECLFTYMNSIKKYLALTLFCKRTTPT